jgi:hypothetical protein
MEKANFKSEFAFACQLLACQVMAMNGFIPSLPQNEEIAPHRCQGAEGPPRSGIGSRVDAKTLHVTILLNTPFLCHVPIENVSPADRHLLLN